MYDLNKVMLIGRLTKDPETRTTTTGKKIATINLAMTMSKNKDTGNSVVEYIECTAWDKLAEIIEKYATKGALVYTEGSIQTQSWDNKETGKKQYKTTVLVRELKILNSKNETSKNNQSQSQSQSHEVDLPDIDLEDIETSW